MGGKSSTIASSEPRLGNLRVQTSMYGLAVPMTWGQTRITGNLGWFGNFQAIAHTTSTSQGGKGGGGVTQVDTKYEYKAAAILMLGSGPIAGIASAWKDKRRYYGAQVPGAQTLRSVVVTVPAGGATFTPPLLGESFAANVSVEIPSRSSYIEETRG